MNDKTPTNPVEPEEDLDTTPPQGVQLENEKRTSDWKMPEPVFRQTSGYLPQGFEKKYGAPTDDPVSDEAVTTETAATEPVEEPSAERPEPVDVPEEPKIATATESPEEPVQPAPVATQAEVAVEPQPDLIAELEAVSEPQPVTTVTAKKKSAVGRIIGIFFALVAVIVLVIIFGLVIWYILTPTPEATFN